MRKILIYLTSIFFVLVSIRLVYAEQERVEDSSGIYFVGIGGAYPGSSRYTNSKRICF